jgi:hypothetical protein
MKKPIQVEVTSREWRERTFQLSGRIEATLEYEVEEIGRERIRVNGRVAADTSGDTLALKRRSLRFSFPALVGAPIPAILDIRDGRIFGTLALRLTVDGEVVYQDRAFARLDRQLRVRRMPLPAAAPSPDAASLPRPGDIPAGPASAVE